jgi:hypothetical protein
MSFFKGMNFPRFVIFVSFLAASGLGWFVYDRTEVLAQLEANLKHSRVDAQITKMQNQGIELERYQEQADASGASDAEDWPSYIRERAYSKVVNIGQLTVTPMSPKPYKNSVDVVYKISPTGKTQNYSRNAIANFLYKLEKDNRRVKVTSYSLKPFTGGSRARSKPGEIFTNNRWTFEAEITHRKKKESQ